MNKLPEGFLRGLGLRDVTYLEKPAVRIPYPDEEGQEVAVRFRVSLEGAERFKCEAATSLVPMGSSSWKKYTVPVTQYW